MERAADGEREDMDHSLRRGKKKLFVVSHPAWDSNPQPPDLEIIEVWRATIAPAGPLQV